MLKLVLNELQSEGDFGGLTVQDTADIDSDDGVSLIVVVWAESYSYAGRRLGGRRTAHSRI